MTDETRKRIGEANKGKTKGIKRSRESIERGVNTRKQKILNGEYIPWNVGIKRPMSEETKQKLSRWRTGKKFPVINHDRFRKSVETRRRNNKLKLSEETKLKISKSQTGKIMPDEIKEKIRIANLGREIKWAEKISKSLMGRSLSKEHKQNLSEKAREYRWISNVDQKISKKTNTKELGNYLLSGWIRGKKFAWEGSLK
jgi:hypothetical protein